MEEKKVELYGRVKQMYMKCPSCGKRAYFGPLTLPRTTASIAFANNAEDLVDPTLTITCYWCQQVVVIGMGNAPSKKDN
jgi:ribosomal protein S27E